MVVCIILTCLTFEISFPFWNYCRQIYILIISDVCNYSGPALKQDPKKSAINPHRFDKLITALRTAIDNGDASNKGPTLMKYFIHLDLH